MLIGRKAIHLAGDSAPEGFDWRLKLGCSLELGAWMLVLNAKSGNSENSGERCVTIPRKQFAPPASCPPTEVADDLPASSP
jgi:hypothetical protein